MVCTRRGLGGERALCLLIGGRCNTCNESASAGCGFPLMSEHPSCPWKEKNNNKKKNFWDVISCPHCQEFSEEVLGG